MTRDALFLVALCVAVVGLFGSLIARYVLDASIVGGYLVVLAALGVCGMLWAHPPDEG
jgi:cyanate permease